METQKNAEMIVHVFQKYIEKFRIPTIYNPAAFFYPETCYHPKKQHCAKSVRIRSYSGPHFPAFGPNMDQNNCEYGHLLRSVADFLTVFFSFPFKAKLSG